MLPRDFSVLLSQAQRLEISIHSHINALFYSEGKSHLAQHTQKSSLIRVKFNQVACFSELKPRPADGLQLDESGIQFSQSSSRIVQDHEIETRNIQKLVVTFEVGRKSRKPNFTQLRVFSTKARRV